MKRTYRSKVELVIALPVLLGLIALETWLIMDKNWLAAGVVAVITGFCFYLYRNTRYEITANNTLRIRIPFLYQKEIYLRSIKKVRRTRNRAASPALSTDRLEISFNRYERILISPDHRLEFIKELKERNPKIMVDQG